MASRPKARKVTTAKKVSVPKKGNAYLAGKGSNVSAQAFKKNIKSLWNPKFG